MSRMRATQTFPYGAGNGVEKWVHAGDEYDSSSPLVRDFAPLFAVVSEPEPKPVVVARRRRNG